MCGIFAYFNCRVPKTVHEILSIIVNGLQRLEYRGYDSSGLCVDGPTGLPCVERKVGHVVELRQAAIGNNTLKLEFESTRSVHGGIAHTRWATHGEPCDRNAHPQSSNDAKFIVVHNGIMTNFSETKLLLQSKGYTFSSDTDTEVIAVLAQLLFETSKPATFSQLAMEVMDVVQGAYALVLKSPHFPNEIVACRRGSPLVIGIKQANYDSHAGVSSAEPFEIFVSSDPSAIAEHTSKVVYLEDDDLVHITSNGVSFFNKARSTDFQKLRCELRDMLELEIELENLSKGSYAHFMLKEIFEQVESVRNSMRGRLDFAKEEVKMGGFSPKHVEAILHARRLVFISCGTSLNSCLAVRPTFDQLQNVPVVVENASDFLDRSPRIFRNDVCFFVSQSGETADTLRAFEYCKERGAIVVGFTNVVGSSISRSTDFGAHLNAGVEIGVASTKAYTSQIVTLTLVALILSGDSISLQPRRREVIQGLSLLSENIRACLANTERKVIEIAEKLKDAKSVLVLGRGYQFATCLEAAPKIKELTYVHTEGINAGELKHGPLALIDEHIPVIILCTKDSLVDRARSAIQQVHARKGKPIAIISEPDAEVESLVEDVIRVPATVDCLQSIINIIPLQLLAYHLAVLRGNNVDCPRNLAKSVTTQ
jgi:glucosamine--fructose-6-phosphate aminotransferase (isomerizing)